VRPASPDRWRDIEVLAGSNGFYSGCWCVWWQTTAKEWDALGANGRRAMLQQSVTAGEEPGLLAYRDGEPVGWVRVGPRDDQPRLQRSPKLKPVDDTPVWAVTCFVVRRDARREGVGRALLDAALEHARSRGATHLEGVPIDTATSRAQGGAALYTGVLSTFESVGFVEIARRGGRPIVRRSLS
jgi:GNAT superfamily N-acetyltransferase